MQPVAAHSVRFVNGVVGTGDNQHLSQLGPGLDIASLLEEIGSHSSGRLSKKLGDIQDPERSRSQLRRQHHSRDITRRNRIRGCERLDVGQREDAVSQSSPRADTENGNWGTDFCSRVPAQERESRSGCR